MLDNLSTSIARACGALFVFNYNVGLARWQDLSELMLRSPHRRIAGRQNIGHKTFDTPPLLRKFTPTTQRSRLYILELGGKMKRCVTYIFYTNEGADPPQQSNRARCGCDVRCAPPDRPFTLSLARPHPTDLFFRSRSGLFRLDWTSTRVPQARRQEPGFALPASSRAANASR